MENLDKDKKYRIEKNYKELRDQILYSQAIITMRLLDKIDNAILDDNIKKTEEWQLRYHHHMIIHGMMK